MGSCLSVSGSSDGSRTMTEAQINLEVERQLKQAKREQSSQVKVLLLGSGDSGKSTIIKQMRVIHKVKWTEREMESYRKLVFGNLIQGMQFLLDVMEGLEMKVSSANIQHMLTLTNVPDLRDGEPFPAKYLMPLQELWDDNQVQLGYERAKKVALPDNLAYFFSDLPRLFQPTYQPTASDIIRVRARTTGITENKFTIGGKQLHMLDVGGQRSERRKWIHCFEDVHALLFLVSLSGYDQCLAEDKDANQMMDALAIWDSVCETKWFRSTSLILFLNKDDLFREKVPTSPIKDTFPDYDGEPGDVEAGRHYFRKRFLRLAVKGGRGKSRAVYPHVTEATNTELLRVIMGSVGDIILRENFVKAQVI